MFRRASCDIRKRALSLCSRMSHARRFGRSAARYHTDLSRVANRTVAALGLHHPDGAADRRARLHRGRARPRMVFQPRCATGASARRQSAGSGEALSRAVRPAGGHRHHRQPCGAGRGMREGRPLQRGRAALRSHPEPADGPRPRLMPSARRKPSFPPSVRPMLWRRWTIFRSNGRTSIPPTHICSTPARSPRSAGSTRRWRNITPSPAISRAPKRGCATACCSRWSAAAPRRAWSSTSS